MADINKTGNNECQRGCGERGTLSHCRWECTLVQPLWKPVWQVLRTLKIELPHGPAFMCPYVHHSTIHSGQDMETTKCPSVEDRIKKMWHIYTEEYYPAIRKDEVLPFVTTKMDLENIMLSEVSQKKLSTTRFHSCVGYKTATHRHRKQCGGYWRERRVWGE